MMGVSSALESATTSDLNVPMSLADELERLAERLEHGYDVVESARAAGAAFEAWEDGWLRMLRRYESLMDRLAA